ncbi:MAG: hypothetical protein M3209_16095, partial [Acidobacteriota bacterium]|nr:hypothetical protein [Acidobacteriota bacterium]
VMAAVVAVAVAIVAAVVAAIAAVDTAVAVRAGKISNNLTVITKAALAIKYAEAAFLFQKTTFSVAFEATS